MTRKEERAELKALLDTLDTLPLFGLNTYEKAKIITALLDNGYRYNPRVLREAADAARGSVNKALHFSAEWLDKRARTMEDLL